MIDCFAVKYEDMPELIGEVCELDELVKLLFGDPLEIPTGAKFSVEFRQLTEQQFDELPDWDP